MKTYNEIINEKAASNIEIDGWGGTIDFSARSNELSITLYDDRAMPNILGEINLKLEDIKKLQDFLNKNYK